MIPFVLFVFVWLVMAASRPSFRAQRNGVNRVGKSESFTGMRQMRSSAMDAAVPIDYDVEAHDDLVSLDGDENVESVHCGKDFVVVTFLVAPTKGSWTKGKVIAGGSEWGCRNANSGVPSSFLLRATSIDWVSEMTANVSTVTASLNDAFSTASIRMGSSALETVNRRAARNMAQLVPTVVTASDLSVRERSFNPRACPSCSFVCTTVGAATIVSPAAGLSVFSNQVVTVQWTGGSGIAVGDCVVVSVVTGSSCATGTPIVSRSVTILSGMTIKGQVGMVILV